MSCFNSTIINAPIDKVWARMKNFHNMDWANSVVTDCQAIGDIAGNQVGAKRILNNAFHETLTSLDNADHQFSYTIDDGPAPLSGNTIDKYIGTVTLYPITSTAQTFIGWQSDFESNDDTAVADFCNPLYTALLAALQESFA